MKIGAIAVGVCTCAVGSVVGAVVAYGTGSVEPRRDSTAPLPTRNSLGRSIPLVSNELAVAVVVVVVVVVVVA